MKIPMLVAPAPKMPAATRTPSLPNAHGAQAPVEPQLPVQTQGAVTDTPGTVATKPKNDATQVSSASDAVEAMPDGRWGFLVWREDRQRWDTVRANTQAGAISFAQSWLNKGARIAVPSTLVSYTAPRTPKAGPVVTRKDPSVIQAPVTPAKPGVPDVIPMPATGNSALQTALIALIHEATLCLRAWRTRL